MSDSLHTIRNRAYKKLQVKSDNAIRMRGVVALNIDSCITKQVGRQLQHENGNISLFNSLSMYAGTTITECAHMLEEK